MNLNPSPKHRFQTEHKDACDAFRRITTSDTLRTALDFALLEYISHRTPRHPLGAPELHGGIGHANLQGAREFIDVLLNLSEPTFEPTKPSDTLNLKT